MALEPPPAPAPVERLFLASHSPRRRQLLAAAGYDFQVVVPDESAETAPRQGESAEQLVLRLAADKAANVASKIAAGLVLAADTVAECAGSILGKPADRAHAREILRALSGRRHSVWTGFCLWRCPQQTWRCWSAQTLLEMHPLSDDQIEAYLDTGLWEGKAGAFGYQDGNDWVQIIRGSESNVVGLPMERLAQALQEFST